MYEIALPVAPFSGYRRDGPRSRVRGSCGMASMVLFCGEGGAPPRPPPPGDIPHGPVSGGDAGGKYDRGWLSGRALSGAIACTAPAHGGGGGAPKARVGWRR